MRSKFTYSFHMSLSQIILRQWVLYFSLHIHPGSKYQLLSTFRIAYNKAISIRVCKVCILSTTYLIIDVCTLDAPPAPVPTEIDRRYYNHLIGSVPPESHSVQLILHCLLEQVSGCRSIFIKH